MNITQIANTIDKNNWAFTVYKTKPEFSQLAKYAYQVEDTAAFISDLITKSKADEIQIIPFKKNGNSFKSGFAKIVTIDLKNSTNNNTNTNTMQHTQHTGLNGGFGLGFSEMVDYRALKNEAERTKETIADLKTKLAEAEKEKQFLQIENRKLETEKATANKEKELDMKLAKLEGKSSIDKLLENPQLLQALITAFKKPTPAPALGQPAPQPQAPKLELSPKEQFILSSIRHSEDALTELLAVICKLSKTDAGKDILSEIEAVLLNNQVLTPNNQENGNDN